MAQPARSSSGRVSSAASDSLIRDFDASGVLTAWLVLLYLVPARFVVPGLGAAGRPAGLFAIAMFVLWAVVTALPNVRTHRSPLRWPIVIWVLMTLVSYLVGHGRGLTGIEATGADRALLNFVSSLGAVLLVSECIPDKVALERLARRVSVFGALIAGVGLVQFVFKYDPYASIKIPGLVLNSDISGLGTRGFDDLVRARGSTQHPIEFAVVLAGTLPYALHTVIHEPHRILRNRWIMVTGLIGVASLLAVSRSAVVAVAASGLVMFWAWSPRIRVGIAGLGMVGLMGVWVAIPGLLGTLRSLFTNWNRDDSISGRTDDYEIVALFVRDRPWFGRGLGTFNPLEYLLLDNAYLQQLAETGLVGLFALLAVLVTAMVLAAQALRRQPSARIRHLAAAILASIFAISLSGGTFDLFFFRTATGVLMFSVGAAAVVHRVERTDTDSPEMWAPPGVLRPGFQPGVRHVGWLSRLVGPRVPQGSAADRTSGP